MNNQPALMTPKQCPSFEGCKSPICPVDPSFTLGAVWFPGEGICAARTYRGESWRKAQVKIARRAIDRESCYTVKMLSALKLVRRETKGIPDGEDSKAESAWLRQHGHRPFADEKGREPDMNKDLVGVSDSQRQPE